MTNVNDSNFDEMVLNNIKPTIVEFWAPWCGPCKMYGPIVEEVVNQFSGELIGFQCNAEEAPDTIDRFGIKNIPTILFFRGNEMVDKFVGATMKENLFSKIKTFLGRD
jgi:thioredoxin 1